MQLIFLLVAFLGSVSCLIHRWGTSRLQKYQGNLALDATIPIEFKPSNKLVQAKEGESISAVAERAGVTINYKCKKGECGTCQVRIDGKWVKACQSVVSAPSSSAVLTINVSSKTVVAAEEEEAAKKKPSKFFSPASFVEGVINNGLGVVGFVDQARKVEDSFEARMAKEKALQAKVAERKKLQGGK